MGLSPITPETKARVKRRRRQDRKDALAAHRNEMAPHVRRRVVKARRRDELAHQSRRRNRT